jgi:mannose-1-phosphate guanylyltransferase
MILDNLEATRSLWCIVVADEHGPGWSIGIESDRIPVQYCSVAKEATPLQRALHRAASIAPSSQIILTALEEYRDYWEPAAWFIRSDRRFIGDNRWASQLSSAAAILSVAAHSPSSIVAILPAKCHVADEAALGRALSHALAQLPGVPEGAATLGMLDAEDAVDENYLIVSRARIGTGLAVDGFARRPVPWVARHLKTHGALVASGIMIGYAGVFAAHISKNWPGISRKLAVLTEAAKIAEAECVVPASFDRNVPKSILNSLRWRPPAFKQRVFGVCRSGWSSLNSPRAVARMLDYSSRRSTLMHCDAMSQDSSQQSDRSFC